MIYLSTTDEVNQTTDDAPQDTPSPTSSDGWPESETSTVLSPVPVVAPMAATRPVVTYPEAIAKGYKLLGHVLISSTASDQFNSPTNLREWGYTTTHKTVLPGHPFHSILQSLAPDSIIIAKEVSSTHTTSTTHDDAKITSTSARFINAFDFENGILIAGSNFGPEFTSQHTTLLDGEQLPKLRHWSDVVYLQSRFLASDESRVPEGVVRPATDAIKGLKAVVRLGIENKDSNAVIHRVLQSKMGLCEYDTVHQMIDAGCPNCCEKIEWPGITFEIGSQAGLALLGTRNGVGVGWLLAQHVELVGKTIARVMVCCDTGKKPLRPTLVFCLEDKDLLLHG